jgi:MSHA biogenesis protein MshQ
MTVGKTCVQDTGNPGVSGQGCATAGPAAERYLALPSLLPPSVGSYNLYMQAPGAGNQGSVDVTANLATTMPWLQYDWNGTGTAIEPTGKASFGLYRASPRSIYLRERY